MRSINLVLHGLQNPLSCILSSPHPVQRQGGYFPHFPPFSNTPAKILMLTDLPPVTHIDSDLNSALFSMPLFPLQAASGELQQ